jgi:putative transposase
VTATRPLEYVMIDHTRVDAWAVVLNDAGRPMLIERPWLTIAIDAYSRMVLGLVLTFEPPSVWSALECLKDVVRKKNYLVRRYGFHKGATDGWGRPYTVICDNGWEFTGLSFQMACEAAGIDVMWAPVKTPMFKAYVERMFGRLNDEVWHKLPSGIPFKPHVMSELKLDPKVKAVHTREQLEGAVWNAIVTMYHLEEHSGIGMAPAKKWREGLRAKRRATVADVSKLDALLGQVKRVQLSAEGVHLSNERFHDEEVTFDLLNRLLRYGKVREQRRNRLSSGTVWVVATINQADVSYVEIWDYSRNISVRLPNWDTESTHGLSWKVREMNRQFADAENLAFHTPKERARARVLHEKFLEMRLDGEGLAMARAAKATSVFAANPLPADDPKLVKGDQVVFQKTDGNHTIAAEEQSGSRLPGKLRPRGGKGKAVSTRAKKANLKALREEAERQLKSLAAGKPIDAVDMPSPPPSASDGDGSARDRVRKDQEKW